MAPSTSSRLKMVLSTFLTTMTTEEEHTKFHKLFPTEPVQSYDVPQYKSFSPKTLSNIGLDPKQILNQNFQPYYLPLKLNINTHQAEDTLLFLRQYYRHRGNLGSSRLEDYVDSNGRGFIIGNGTGTGKSRSIAAEILSVIAVEEYMLTMNHPNRLNGNPVCIWVTLSKSHIAGAKAAFRECLNSDSNEEDSFSMRSLMGDLVYVRMLEDEKKFLKMPATETSRYPIVIFTTYQLLHTNLTKFTKMLLSHQNTYPSYTAFDEFHQFMNVSSEMRAALADVDHVENTLYQKKKTDWLKKLQEYSASATNSSSSTTTTTTTTTKRKAADIEMRNQYEELMDKEIYKTAMSIEDKFKEHFNSPPLPEVCLKKGRYVTVLYNKEKHFGSSKHESQKNDTNSSNISSSSSSSGSSDDTTDEDAGGIKKTTGFKRKRLSDIEIEDGEPTSSTSSGNTVRVKTDDGSNRSGDDDGADTAPSDRKRRRSSSSSNSSSYSSCSGGSRCSCRDSSSSDEKEEEKEEEENNANPSGNSTNQKIWTTSSLTRGSSNDTQKWMQKHESLAQRYKYSDCFFQTPHPSVSLTLASYLCRCLPTNTD